MVTDYFIEGTWQKVYNSLDNAVNALSSNASHSVYDYAVVLVGNYHLVKQALLSIMEASLSL